MMVSKYTRMVTVNFRIITTLTTQVHLNTRMTKLVLLINSLMTVWMMCSSIPVKKEISAVAVLIVQVGFEERMSGFVVEVFLFSVCNVTGTIVSFCCGI